MKIAFVSDFFLDEIIGGGEICDDCIIRNLSKSYNVERIKSHILTIELTNQYEFLIISNFTFVKETVLNYITNNSKYLIYEHDYKFLLDRNPAKYINFIAPKNIIQNQ